MTYVFIQLAAQSVLVITDTQHSDLDQRPIGYGQKVFHVEQLRSLVTFAGDPRLIQPVLDHLHSPTSQDLDEVVVSLREALRQARADIGRHANGHRTHIAGFPADSASPVLYLLDEDDDFEPERLEPDVTWVQPLPLTFSPTAPQTIADYVDLAERIRADHAPGTIDNPVGIGGDLIAVYLSRTEMLPQHWHTFPDEPPLTEDVPHVA